MDHTQNSSDIPLSPSQILERLQVLRQLQLFQRGKLQKQRLQYEESPETSSSVTEIVSHFSNSTSYNTFRSLLQITNDTSTEGTPHIDRKGANKHVKNQDLVEGISVLNLSQESEYLISPNSSKSRGSITSRSKSIGSNETSPMNGLNQAKATDKKQISLDDMPILSPRKDFEALIIEKLNNEKSVPKSKSPKNTILASQTKRPFLKRGEGMVRFGLRKNDLVIQNTKSLPWRRNNSHMKRNPPAINKSSVINGNKKVNVQIIVPENKILHSSSNYQKLDKQTLNLKRSDQERISNQHEVPEQNVSNLSSSEEKKDSAEDFILNNNSPEINNCELHNKKKKVEKTIPLPKEHHPSSSSKAKTWASVLTREQDDLLRQMKQSNFYKNFASPAKSIVSDISYDESLIKLAQERERAEQNMFDLLESKTSQENFGIENSFIDRFINHNKLECSGESTPLTVQKCLAENPNLMHLYPDFHHQQNNKSYHMEEDSCSECTECCSDTCTSTSTCCSCKTIEEVDNSHKNFKDQNDTGQSKIDKQITTNEVLLEKEKCQNDKEIEDMKANMAEMNVKLIATSDLLKERLRELEDEIETFRNENVNLSKMREEIDLERQKFYEEKSGFEKKFNEEKILSEYYLAEEKEKLTKQKQMYERYVREIRGRLNKKEKDEVVNLRKEINDLKEEIRLKDAKSTSTIARLRNQMKIMEKEKKDFQVEIEKLKKENRRIQHSNDITRRLTNIKYLEEINKKLTNISNKNNKAFDSDNNIKYKAFEIERQSRSRSIQPKTKSGVRPRAKSVPNLKVTSRYAKYFSQRDVISEIDRERSNTEHIEYGYSSDDDMYDRKEEQNLDTESIINKDLSDNDENNLEKIYIERFKANSPRSVRSSLSNSEIFNKSEPINTHNDYFIHKSNSNRNSRSPNRASEPHSNISPISILSNKSGHKATLSHHLTNKSIEHASISSLNSISNRSKSPISVVSNNSSSNRNETTVVNRDQYVDKLCLSPEPTASKASLNKTILNPTEIQKADGTRELRFPNGNVKYISPDGKYCKFVYYNGDIKENFYDEGRIKYYYAETKTFHTTYADGLEVLEFPDGQVEKRYKDGSSEIRLPNGSIRYSDPKNEHVREEWRFPDGASLTVSANGDQRIVFSNGQVEVHTKDHKRREFPDGTVKLVYNDGTSETRYASGRVRIKDKHGNLIMDSASS